MSGRRRKSSDAPRTRERSKKDPQPDEAEDLRPASSDENFEHVLRRLVIERDKLGSRRR